MLLFTNEVLLYIEECIIVMIEDHAVVRTLLRFPLKVMIEGHAVVRTLLRFPLKVMIDIEE
ncbi:Hypothetical protein HVR_LOCUS976 [uncultured virus]|nr:Hypothetical protein HVR_LOCUS976 [uncultured virus]